MPYCPECSASTPDDAERCPTCGAELADTTSTGDAQPDAPEPLLIDTDSLQEELAASVTSQYEILRPLGVGGMGAVYLAKEPALRRLVAITVLAPHLAADARARARFEREARAAAALSHPNVVRVFAVGETAKRQLPYIVMQYVQGATLTHWMIERSGRVGQRDARRIVGEIASALAAAHARGLVHRDVKPSNVLVEDESGRAFVADFGVSAAISPRFADETKLTATGAVVGTPAYMSPEQASADRITPKSDVYSLGVVAYELLVGSAPFQATTAMGWAAAHLRDTPTPVAERRPEVAPDIARLVDRCLAKEPTTRPDALEIARGFLPDLAGEIDWPPPGLAPLRGRAGLVTRLAAAVTVAAIWTLSALAFTPGILQVHPDWLGAYQAVAEASARPMTGLSPAESAVRSLFLWQNITLLGATTFLLALGAFAAVGLRGLRDLTRHRGLGWRTTTLLDVVVDHDGRTGRVLSGTRELASLEEDARARVLLMRRLAPAAVLGASAWLVLVITVWLLALATGLYDLEHTGGAVGRGLWYAATVPAVVLLAVSAALRAYESHLMWPTGRRHAYEAGLGEVTSWYAQVPSAPRPTPPRPWQRIGPVTAMQIAGGAAAAVIAVGLLETAVAALIAGAVTQRLGPQGVELRALLRGVENDDPLGTALGVLAEYLPAQDTVADSVSMEWARSLTHRSGAGESALPDYGPYSPLIPGGNRPELIRPAVISAFGRARLGRIPPDTLALLDTISRHPRTQRLRALARASRVDLLGSSLDRPLAAYESWFNLPQPNVNELRRAALANTHAAILAVARGDPDAAAQRLGETGAVVAHLLAVPTLAASEVGLDLLANHVLWPLAEVELIRGDARKAQELRSAARGFDLVFATFSYSGAAALAADPGNLAAYSELLTTSLLPIGWRVEMFPASWLGLCTNPREILLGPTPERRDVVLDAVGRMDGVPHVREIALLVAEDLEGPRRGLGAPPRGLLDRAWRLRPWRVLQVADWCSSM